MNKGISLSHSNPYGFAELNLMQLSFQQTFHNYAIGFGAYLNNNSKISDRQLYCSYTHSYQQLQAGLLLRYLENEVKNYTTNNSVVADLGFIWKNKNFRHGISISNITQSKTNHISISSPVKFETSFIVNDFSNIGFSFEKEKNFDCRYAFASSIKFYKENKIFMGFMTNPAQFSSGLDIIINNKAFVYGIRTHQYLDLTHSISMIYNF